jgi:uncharacterized protein (DUF1778 family)
MSSAQQDSIRREPLNLRWRPEDRALIDRAARVRSVTRTDFMVGASRDRAMEVLLDQAFIELQPDALAAFTKQLDAPPKPNTHLRTTLAAPRPWE